jgi:hypothetical protein
MRGERAQRCGRTWGWPRLRRQVTHRREHSLDLRRAWLDWTFRTHHRRPTGPDNLSLWVPIRCTEPPSCNVFGDGDPGDPRRHSPLRARLEATDRCPGNTLARDPPLVGCSRSRDGRLTVHWVMEGRASRMLMEVTCRCGWSTRGSKSAVIRTVQTHAKSAHNLAVSPQEIRAVWRIVEDEPPKGRRRSGQPHQ